MSLMWAIYLIEALGNLKDLLAGAMVVAAIFCFLVPPITDFDLEQARKIWTKIGIGVAAAALVFTFIPSRQTMYAMGAAHAAQQIIENPKVQELGGKAFEILNRKLDEFAGKKEKSK